MATTQGIKLDDETRNRLRVLAEKRHRSPHWLMRTAIERYLAHEEQYELEKSEDIQRWEQYQLTGEAIDSDRVEVWLSELTAGKVTSWPRP